jgi:hypothetical protein
MWQIIPFINQPQKFEIGLNGLALTIRCVFNAQLNLWVLSLIDTATQKIRVANIPIVAGVNLISQYPNILAGTLICLTAGAEFEPPTFENLGVESLVAYNA